jgi:putative transposase
MLRHALSFKRGDCMTYISGVENLLEIKKQCPDLNMIRHSDQDSVYAPKAFDEILSMYESK